MYIVDRRFPFVSAHTQWSEGHNIWYAGDDVLEELGHSTIYDPFYEVHSTTTCWKCGQKTPVVSLGVSKVFHHKIDHGVEHSHPHNVLICYEMSQLPDDIIAHFCQFECFGMVFTRKNGHFWGNKCIRCGVVQGEYYLGFNNRDGGPFNSVSPAENRRVKIVEELTGQRIVSLVVTHDDAFRRPEYEQELPKSLCKNLKEFSFGPAISIANVAKSFRQHCFGGLTRRINNFKRVIRLGNFSTL